VGEWLRACSSNSCIEACAEDDDMVRVRDPEGDVINRLGLFVTRDKFRMFAEGVKNGAFDALL
jgi:hypothetical protein